MISSGLGLEFIGSDEQWEGGQPLLSTCQAQPVSCGSHFLRGHHCFGIVMITRVHHTNRGASDTRPGFQLDMNYRVPPKLNMNTRVHAAQYDQYR
jgi:hypothetical protein